MKTISAIAALVLTVALTLCTAGCEAGLAAPKDPGTVRARVVDQTGAPVASVPFSIANSEDTGWLTMDTHSDGTIAIPFVSAGTHRTWVTLPKGYTAIPDSLTKYLSVSKGQTTDVTFTLTKT